MVNPYDLEGMADAIYAAFIMTSQERQRRMRLLRQEVKRNDVNKWVESFLSPDTEQPTPVAIPAEALKAT